MTQDADTRRERLLVLAAKFALLNTKHTRLVARGLLREAQRVK